MKIDVMLEPDDGLAESLLERLENDVRDAALSFAEEVEVELCVPFSLPEDRVADPSWPDWWEMTTLVLHGGPEDNAELPLAPTMPVLVYKGESYFRMPDSRGILSDGSVGGSYLWSSWTPATGTE